MRRLAILLAGFALLAAGCGKSSGSENVGELVIAVDVPVTGSPYVAQTIRQGVELAASNLNGGGGVRVGSKSYRLKVKLYDNHLSARRAVQDTRRALDAGAAAIVTDGTGRRRDLGARAARRRLDRHRLRRRDRARRRRDAAERLPDRADEPRDRLPLRRVPGAEEAEGRAPLRRQRVRARRSRRRRPRVLREPGGRRAEADAARRRRRTSPRRSCERAGRALPPCSSGARRRRSRPCSRPRAALAGRCPSTRRRPGPTRSSASSSPTTRSGWTVSPSPPGE